ncbi:suppressor of SWI4 1 homolog [Bos indicus x Bos taurus]|uniref:suppressor of SWI4 1 homolog n=1 Tax=Bos indicus x Bos taurus TaxID=30522 RepID=UPI000F7D51E6|nr:suppressor of SWI4 1 homolog [Bos indicus x Bos taurus]
MGQSGRSRHQKRARAQAHLRNLEAYAAQPHSFVFARGRVGRSVQQLSMDLRRVMEPLTATRLQIRKKNSLKDCVAVAGPLGVTHFLIVSKTETNVYFKLMRLPGGPTLTFRINKYTLVRDVVSSLRRHRMHEQQFAHPPLLVLNSFGPHGMHVKLMATMFQNLFPSINVHKVNLNTIKRCLLINYNPDSQELDFRHYSIKVVPVGASRGMKKLLQEKFPNMSRLQDISELLATGAGLSESEAEPDGEHNITELPQAVAGRGNMRAQQSAVRLTEIGPRMTLELIKIQEGVGEGNVLFHRLVHKTEEELQAILAAKEEKLRLKAQRQDQQAQNVRRKREQREAHKKKSLAGMKRARAEADGDSDAEDPGAPPEAERTSQQEEEEDEAEYFRQAVGEEPDEDMFPKAAKRRRPTGPPGKKQRLKERKPDRGSDRRPQKAKGKGPGAQAKVGPRGAARNRGQGRPRPLKRAAWVVLLGRGGASGLCLRREHTAQATVQLQTQRQAMQASASNSSGDTQCPVNFSEAADSVLSGLQDDFLWPMLVVEFLVALAGNSLALYRFCSRKQHLWPPAMIFSAQLAVSDLLYALTLPPLAAYIYPPKHWRYGEAACRLERFLFTCNLLGSVIFITCISLNRYMGIVHPFFTHSQLRPKHAWAVSAAGWVLAVLLAAPTLSFSHLSESQRPGQCSVANLGACTKCLGTAGDSQLEAYRVYSLALATLGCGLPLLLTLAAYGALGRAVQHSHGMTAANKLQVTVLVASGVALYASSYVPYYITAVLNVYARLRWLALCPGFTSEAAAKKALDQRTYLAHQVTRGLVPLAICIHPLLYMAVVPSLDCCHQCCGQGQTPKSTTCSSQALPLNVTATPQTSGLQSHELSP